MSSSVDVDNKGKDILVLGEESTHRLDDTTLTADKLADKLKQLLFNDYV